MSDFDEAVGRIARKRAIWHFAKRAWFAILIVALAVGLAGCQREQVCVGGQLYERDSSDDVYVQDQWGRNCVDPARFRGMNDE